MSPPAFPFASLMADLMMHSRRQGAAVLTGLALLMGSTALMMPAAAYAQAQQGVVQRIVVIGNERIEASTIASYIRFSRVMRSIRSESTWR
jgi:outer membrane protein insertion porin family